MAMVRLPTRASHGKANLHQGAVGAGIDLATGITLDGVIGTEVVTQHPTRRTRSRACACRTGTTILDISARCYELTGLGYIGVDIVLDRDLGPLVLELNARPGLAIQIANRQGLLRRLEDLRRARRLRASPAQRIESPNGNSGTRSVRNWNHKASRPALPEQQRGASAQSAGGPYMGRLGCSEQLVAARGLMAGGVQAAGAGDRLVPWSERAGAAKHDVSNGGRAQGIRLWSASISGAWAGGAASLKNVPRTSLGDTDEDRLGAGAGLAGVPLQPLFRRRSSNISTSGPRPSHGDVRDRGTCCRCPRRR